jgi:hypothetical protein
MSKIEAFFTRLYIKVFGQPTTVKYLSGKGQKTKNNENR